MKFKKLLSGVLTGCMLMSMIACGNEPSEQKNANTPTPKPTEAPVQKEVEAEKPFWQSLSPTVSGQLDIMVWSGDSTYYEDLGSKDWAPEDITSQNVAAVYAMAKEFNKLYPNVKINLYAKADDPNANDTSWSQELENFKALHGKYPDIYAANDLVGDLSRGFVADLSVYSDDVLYKSFNESIMKNMNYYGFQAGLPQFMQPWGVYVNRALAETNNIEMPDPDWDIDEYTEVASQRSNDGTWWGAVQVPISFINTGCEDIMYSLSNYSGTGDHINLTTDAVADLLGYFPSWSEGAIWQQFGLGRVSTEVMDDGWWWGYRMFCRNYALTYDGDPWMLGAAAMGQSEDGTWPVNSVESKDWDIYPRPSTDYVGNTIGICIDPMAIHNFAMDDGNPAWSSSEIAQLDLAYAFGSFWCGSTESMQARASQLYSDNGTLRTSLNDSFPLVTGEAFEEQMKIWYSTETHARYSDKDLMPGFAYVLELWEAGDIWDISDKTYPYYVTVDGETKTCMYEWLNYADENVAGAKLTDSNYVDNVKARLADWNASINARFILAEDNLKAGLKAYYGMTDADFK